MNDHLWQHAEARWRAIAGERPDLEPAIALQRTLISRIIGAERRLAVSDMPDLDFPARYLALKIARGVPMLQGERIPVPVVILAPLLTAFACDLAAGGAGPAAEHVAEALSSGRIEAGSLLAASLSRDQEGIRITSNQLGLAPDLVWLIGELASSAFAHALGQSLWPPIPGHVEESSSVDGTPDAEAEAEGSVWNRGYCPTCGSWPTLIELNHEARVLRCSFCASGWQTRIHRCVYCGDTGEGFRVIAPDMERPDRLVELCNTCGGYLKAVQLGNSIPFPLLAIEDLATVDLDRAAMEQGFRRPPLPSTYPA